MIKLTSKAIRQELETYEPICVFKVGAICTPAESSMWGLNLGKVSSVRHRSILLRVAHGDVYTKEKLFRFGMNESPNCPRCGEIETLQHKLISCGYTKAIWDKVLELTKEIKPFDVSSDRTNLIIGAIEGMEPIILSIHAEVILRILGLKDDATYMLRPVTIARLALELVAKRERKDEVKQRIKALLEADSSA